MSLIYTPSGRAREYSSLACNIYSGCAHGCTYCYAPAALRRDRTDFHANPTTRKDFLNQLEKEAEKLQGTKDRVLLCFTTDPYQPIDTEVRMARKTIKVLHRYGIPVQVLTKGGSRALRDLDLFGAGDAFATTLTLLSDEHSATWEPDAALPKNRINTLRMFHQAGVETWVSLEPVLNPDSALEIIRRTHKFVDLYKVGTLNHHPLAARIDWPMFAVEVVDLLEQLGKSYYIKDDLRKHLQQAAA